MVGGRVVPITRITLGAGLVCARPTAVVIIGTSAAPTSASVHSPDPVHRYGLRPAHLPSRGWEGIIRAGSRGPGRGRGGWGGGRLRGQSADVAALMRRWLSYVGLLALVFAMGVAQEALVTFRMKLRKRQVKEAEAGAYSRAVASTEEDDTEIADILFRPPPLRMLSVSGLYSVSLLLSYMLMLAAMTYNIGIFFAAILGLCAGHTVFYREPGEFTMDHGL